MDVTLRARASSAAFRSSVQVLFFLSGAVGLLYEVAWFRRLHLLLGVSSFAIGAVVAAFMLGLAAGSRWGGSSRWLRNNPLATYAWLEAGIALYALAFPTLVDSLEGSYVVLFGFLEGHFLIKSIARFVLSFVLLLPPTFLMGATLPALAQTVARGSPEMARRVGWLYAVNTLGGMTGTLAAGFYALEHFGIRGTIHLGLAGNLLVAISAFLLTRHPTYRDRPPTEEPEATDRLARAPEAAVERSLALFAATTVTVTGLVSMAAEIVWTRALVFFIHNSTYAFTSILAVYLLGIAAGATLGARLVRSSESAKRWLAATLGTLSLCTLCSIAIYRHLPEISQFLLGVGGAVGEVVSASPGKPMAALQSWSTALVVIFGQVAVVLFIPALLSGMVFPLALRLAQGARPVAAAVAGKLYAANTVGCIVGTILGTFVLVALLGTRLALLLLAWLPLPLALWAILEAVRGKANRTMLVGSLLFVQVVGSMLAAPAGFYRELFERRFGKVIWFSEGVSETVAVCEHPDGVKWVQYSDGRGASGTRSYSGGWLYAHLPLLLHPDPHSALVICFGTGNTLGAASRHDLETLDGVELSSEVVNASHVFSDTNYDVANNPDVNVIIEDGRNYLLSTRKRYDVITEEPPLVHTAGVINLYSKDYYELCRDRMTESGVMAVWLATWELETRELRMLVKAFVDAFPHTSLWDSTHTGEWLLIGSKKPLQVDLDALERRMSVSRLAGDLGKIGGANSINAPADLLSLYLKGRQFLVEFAGDIDPVTDDKTVVDYTTPRQVRANFGLGERVTAGVYVIGVGRHGSAAATRAREFNSVYISPESVEALVTSYGSRDPDEFLDRVRQKQARRHVGLLRNLIGSVMSAGMKLRSRGKLQESLDVFNRGLGLVPPAESAGIHAGAALVYHDLGRDAEAEQAMAKAHGIDPQNEWVERVRRRISRRQAVGNTPSP